jgi:hypothetical protein
MTTHAQYWTAESLDLATLYPQARTKGDFTVFVDGGMSRFQTRRAFEKALLAIYSAKPRAFINSGGGITVDFD